MIFCLVMFFKIIFTKVNRRFLSVYSIYLYNFHFFYLEWKCLYRLYRVKWAEKVNKKMYSLYKSHVCTSRSRIFHLYGDVTITGEGLQNLGLCSALRAFWAGRDLYRASPAVTRDLGLSGLIRRTTPFSRLLRYTRGCRGSILTRILTGLLHVTQNFDKQNIHVKLLGGDIHM